MSANYSPEVRQWLDERTKRFFMEKAPQIPEEVRNIPSTELDLDNQTHKDELTRRIKLLGFENRITDDQEEEERSDEDEGALSGLSMWQ